MTLSPNVSAVAWIAPDDYVPTDEIQSGEVTIFADDFSNADIVANLKITQVKTTTPEWVITEAPLGALRGTKYTNFIFPSTWTDEQILSFHNSRMLVPPSLESSLG